MTTAIGHQQIKTKLPFYIQYARKQTARTNQYCCYYGTRLTHSVTSSRELEPRCPFSSNIPMSSFSLHNLSSMEMNRNFTTLSNPTQNKSFIGKKSRTKFIPKKASVNLTPKSREFFKTLLSIRDESSAGIMLRYEQSKTEPRMIFNFGFVTEDELGADDEPVSLEVTEDGITPKPHKKSIDDGLPKLYIHHNAFMKVLGATIDMDEDGMTPILYDREGNVMDPNNA